MQLCRFLFLEFVAGRPHRMDLDECGGSQELLAAQNEEKSGRVPFGF